MKLSNEQKRAKKWMYLFLGICIVCFLLFVTALIMQWHRTGIASVIAGGWASSITLIGERNIYIFRL